VSGMLRWLVVVSGFAVAMLAAQRNCTGSADICWFGGNTVSCIVLGFALPWVGYHVHVPTL